MEVNRGDVGSNDPGEKSLLRLLPLHFALVEASSAAK
jgi:hypothetical protein